MLHTRKAGQTRVSRSLQQDYTELVITGGKRGLRFRGNIAKGVPLSGFNEASCRGQVVTPASQDSTAVVEGTGTSDVPLLLKTGLRYIPKWKTEG